MKIKKKTFENAADAQIYAQKVLSEGAYDVTWLPKDGTRKYIVTAYYLRRAI